MTLTPAAHRRDLTPTETNPMWIRACMLGVLASQTAAPEPGPAPAPPEHGKISWYEGSWDELLARAAETERLVLVDFWSRWCSVCKKLDRTTFSDDEVVAELADVLCFSAEMETEEGRALARRFGVKVPPVMVFLEPDGRQRDRISVFLPPKPFLAELRRIERNEGTLSGLQAEVERDPGDLAARYALARKLREMGNEAGYRAQIDAIRALDPEGRSRVMRRVRLDDLVAEFKRNPNRDQGELTAFLASETDRELLFHGWELVWSVEGYLMRESGSGEGGADHLRRWILAGHELWNHAPEDQRAEVGNMLAWTMYENHDRLDRAEREFALEVARQAVAAAPEAAHIVDTLACCLYVLGRRDDAIREVRRCLQLEPENEQWRKRLEEFTRD